MAVVRVSLTAAGAPNGRYGRSSSLKWPWLYDKLVAKGYSKSKAAAISNSRLSTRKGGRLNVLKASQAHDPKVQARIRKADKAGKHVTGKQLTASANWTNTYEFACRSKTCAPPPVGTGGSKPSNIRALGGLRSPDSGFTLSTKLAPLRSGFAVALKDSDKLVTAESGYDSNGKPSKKMIALVRDRISAAMKVTPPKGTKLALGGWHNPEDGKIEINVTVVFPKTRQAEAMRFAKEQDQIALFALHKGEVIMTGGTGGERAAE